MLSLASSPMGSPRSPESPSRLHPRKAAPPGLAGPELSGTFIHPGQQLKFQTYKQQKDLWKTFFWWCFASLKENLFSVAISDL